MTTTISMLSVLELDTHNLFREKMKESGSEKKGRKENPGSEKKGRKENPVALGRA